MGRAYAGILGSIAFGVVVAHGLVHRHSVMATLYVAPAALFAFAAVGLVIGWIADRTIVETIEHRFHAQLKADYSPKADVITDMNPAGGGSSTA